MCVCVFIGAQGCCPEHSLSLSLSLTHTSGRRTQRFCDKRRLFLLLHDDFIINSLYIIELSLFIYYFVIKKPMTSAEYCFFPSSCYVIVLLCYCLAMLLSCYVIVLLCYCFFKSRSLAMLLCVTLPCHTPLLYYCASHSLAIILFL